MVGPGRSPDHAPRYRLLGHARGPSSHHPRSDPGHDNPRRPARGKMISGGRSRYRGRASSAAGDRIMFRYLDDGTSLRNASSHPWRPLRGSIVAGRASSRAPIATDLSPGLDKQLSLLGIEVCVGYMVGTILGKWMLGIENDFSGTRWTGMWSS